MENELIEQFFPLAVLAIGVLAALTFAIISVVLNHHWSKYGIPGEHLKRVRVIYFSVSAVLFILIVTFAVAAINLP